MASRRYVRTPVHERETANILAKGRGRVLTSALSQSRAKHSADQYFNRLQYERLFGAKKSADDYNKYQEKMYNLNMSGLKDERRNLGLQTWLGLGGAGIGYLVGEDRRKKMEEDRLARQAWEKKYLDEAAANRGLTLGLLSQLTQRRRPTGGM